MKILDLMKKWKSPSIITGLPISNAYLLSTKATYRQLMKSFIVLKEE